MASTKNVLRSIAIGLFIVALVLVCLCTVSITAKEKAAIGYIYEGSTSPVMFGATFIKLKITNFSSDSEIESALQCKPLAFPILGLCLGIVGMFSSLIFTEKAGAKNRFAHFFFALLIAVCGVSMFFAKSAFEAQMKIIDEAVGFKDRFYITLNAPGFVIGGIMFIASAVLKFWSVFCYEY